MNPKRRQGFTFAEVLAALAFVAIVVPVLTQALLLSGETASVASRQEIAAELADEMLTRIVATGEWDTTGNAGSFGEDWPGYRWELQVEDWTGGAMQELTVRVWFSVRGRERDIALSTLVAEPASVTMGAVE